jgi:hypothetical protein
MVTRESTQTVLADIGRCYDIGWSDGLPVVPPYRYLVDEMLDALGWKFGDIVGRISAQRLDISAQHLASAAVMAGCLPEYAAVLRPLSELLVDPEFNISGVEVTTGGPGVLVVVSGPVVSQLGFEHGANAVGGANARPNATVGRFANLVRLFCGNSGGVLEQHGTMGHPGRYSFCIAEHPQTRWGPFHTQLGIDGNSSAVSIMAAEGPNSVNNHYAGHADQILETIAGCLGHPGFTNWYWHFGACIVVIGPQHAQTIAESYTRDEARHLLFEMSRRPTDDLAQLGRMPTEPRDKSKVEPGTMRSPFDHESQIHLLESGADGGKFSAVIPGWVGDYTVMTREIS